MTHEPGPGRIDEGPLKKCLDDVADTEVYVGILAWRYGSAPTADGSPAPALAGTSLASPRWPRSRSR